MGFWLGLMSLPPPAGDAAAGRMMGLVWRQYFPARTASAPDTQWLRGVRSEPMRKTGPGVSKLSVEDLDAAIGSSQVRTLVVFGAHDIYETAADLLRARFPNARHVILENAWHFPWIQDAHAFRELLDDFYGVPSAN